MLSTPSLPMALTPAPSASASQPMDAVALAAREDLLLQCATELESQISTLLRERETLQVKLQRAQDETKRAKGTIASLRRSQMVASTSSFASSGASGIGGSQREALLLTLEKEVLAKKDEVRALLREIEGREQEALRLERVAKVREEHVADMLRHAQEQTTTLREREQELATREQGLAQDQEEVKHRVEALEAQEKSLDSHTHELDAAMAEVRGKAEKLRERELALAERAKVVAEKETEVQSMDGILESQRQERLELDARTKEIEAKQATLEEKAELLEERRARLQEWEGRLGSREEGMDETKRTLEETRIDLERRESEAQRAMDQTEKRMREREEEARGTLERVEERVRALEARREELEGEIDGLQREEARRREAMEERLRQGELAWDSVHEDVQGVRRELEEKCQRLAEVAGETRELEGRAEMARKQIHAKRHHLRELDKKVEGATAELTKVSMQAQGLHREVEREKEVFFQYQRETTEEVERMKAQALKEVRLQGEATEAEAGRLKAEWKAERAALKKEREQLERMREAVEHRRREQEEGLVQAKRRLEKERAAFEKEAEAGRADKREWEAELTAHRRALAQEMEAWEEKKWAEERALRAGRVEQEESAASLRRDVEEKARGRETKLRETEARMKQEREDLERTEKSLQKTAATLEEDRRALEVREQGVVAEGQKLSALARELRKREVALEKERQEMLLGFSGVKEEVSARAEKNTQTAQALAREREELETWTSRLMREAGDMKQAREAVEKERTAVEATRLAVQATQKDLREQLEACQQERALLEAKNVEADAKRSRAEDRLDMAEEKVGEAERKLKQALKKEREVEEIAARYEVFTQELEEGRAQVREAKRRMEEYKKALEEAEAQVLTLQGEGARWRERLATSEAILSERQKALEEALRREGEARRRSLTIEESERMALEAAKEAVERREAQLRSRALELECLADNVARRDAILLSLEDAYFQEGGRGGGQKEGSDKRLVVEGRKRDAAEVRARLGEARSVSRMLEEERMGLEEKKKKLVQAKAVLDKKREKWDGERRALEERAQRVLRHEEEVKAEAVRVDRWKEAVTEEERGLERRRRELEAWRDEVQGEMERMRAEILEKYAAATGKEEETESLRQRLLISAEAAAVKVKEVEEARIWIEEERVKLQAKIKHVALVEKTVLQQMHEVEAAWERAQEEREATSDHPPEAGKSRLPNFSGPPRSRERQGQEQDITPRTRAAVALVAAVTEMAEGSGRAPAKALEADAAPTARQQTSSPASIEKATSAPRMDMSQPPAVSCSPPIVPRPSPPPSTPVLTDFRTSPGASKAQEVLARSTPLPDDGEWPPEHGNDLTLESIQQRMAAAVESLNTSVQTRDEMLFGPKSYRHRRLEEGGSDEASCTPLCPSMPLTPMSLSSSSSPGRSLSSTASSPIFVGMGADAEVPGQRQTEEQGRCNTEEVNATCYGVKTDPRTGLGNKKVVEESRAGETGSGGKGAEGGHAGADRFSETNVVSVGEAKGEIDGQQPQNSVQHDVSFEYPQEEVQDATENAGVESGFNQRRLALTTKLQRLSIQMALLEDDSSLEEGENGERRDNETENWEGWQHGERNTDGKRKEGEETDILQMKFTLQQEIEATRAALQAEDMTKISSKDVH